MSTRSYSSSFGNRSTHDRRNRQGQRPEPEHSEASAVSLSHTDELKDESPVPLLAQLRSADILKAVRDGAAGHGNMAWYFDADDSCWRLCKILGRGDRKVIVMTLLRQFQCLPEKKVVTMADFHEELTVPSIQDVVSTLCKQASSMLSETKTQWHWQTVLGFSKWCDADSMRPHRGEIEVTLNRARYMTTLSGLRCVIGGEGVNEANARIVELEHNVAELQREQNERSSRESQRMKSQVEDLQRKGRKLQQQLSASKNALTEANRERESLRVKMQQRVDEQSREIRQKASDATRMKNKLRELNQENERMDRESEQLMRENEAFRDAQDTYTEGKQELTILQEINKKLEVDNSTLRDKLSELKGGSRTLGSAFWSPKEILRARKDLMDQNHQMVTRFLEDRGMELEDAYTLLWDVFVDVNNMCLEKFARLSTTFHLDQNGILRNVFLSKIQDHFLTLLDEVAAVAEVKEHFQSRASALVPTDTFREFVEASLRICWALVLSSEPAMEFFPLSEEQCLKVIGNVFNRNDFKTNFECDLTFPVKKNVARVEVLQFVFPGIRIVGGTNKTLVKPCVVAEKAKSKAPAPVVEEQASAPAAELDESSDNGSVPGVSQFDEDEKEVPSESEVGQVVDVDNFDFTDINKLLTDWHFDDAWNELVSAGFDIKSGGRQEVMLCCGECKERTILGSFYPDGDYVCAVDDMHIKLVVDEVRTV